MTGEGDRGRATEALSHTHGIVQGLGALPLGEEVEGLARRARIDLPRDDEAEEPVREAPGPAEQIGLTPRERDVLELLVQGKTNTQIAKALFISDKTASVHVSHILAKLGVANKVEAAGIAYRRGLVESASD